jgi:hypothetical protein
MPDVVAEIAERAAAASPFWARSIVLPGKRVGAAPAFPVLEGTPFQLGFESIYEAFLVHYGRARAFAPHDRDEAILLGDHLYADGLVAICRAGDVEAVAIFADLVSMVAHLVAEETDAETIAAVWAGAARLIAGDRAGSWAEAREALGRADHRPLAALGAGEVAAVLELAR